MIIPASNVQHLMLREDVVEAVRKAQFKVYSVSTIDDALELLTGVEAGKKDANGSYPAESINGRAQAQLTRFAKRLQSFSRSGVSDDGTV